MLGKGWVRQYSWILLMLFLGISSCRSSVSQTPKADPYFKLLSSADIDYKPLQALLRQRQWKDADRETFRILLKISNREAEGWLSQKEVENLACDDLHTINDLWNYYSDRRFGFSQQQQIWEAVGGRVGEYTPETAEQFGDRVGWRKWGQWRKYDQLNFSDYAPVGHLPATTGNGVSGGVWNGVASITHRLKYCRLVDALANRQWVKADWETLALFDAYRIPFENSSAPAPLVISEIPCHELQGIDQLWRKFSDQRFGLSVQTPIVKSTGNDAEKLDWRKYEQLEQALGWRIDPREDSYNNIDAKKIPLGHFPYRLGYSYDTFGSGFNRTWRLSINPECGF